MSIRVGSALMGLPKVAILRSHVSLHCLPDDKVANVLELGVIDAVAFGPELSLHRPDTMAFQKLEQGEVFHDRHLDDLCHAMAQPSGMQSLPEASICDRQHRWVVGAVKVLVVVAVAAHAR